MYSASTYFQSIESNYVYVFKSQKNKDRKANMHFIVIESEEQQLSIYFEQDDYIDCNF